MAGHKARVACKAEEGHPAIMVCEGCGEGWPCEVARLEAERDAAIERGKRLWFLVEIYFGELCEFVDKAEAAERELAEQRALAAVRLGALEAATPHLIGIGVPKAVLRRVGIARTISPAEAQEEGDPRD